MARILVVDRDNLVRETIKLAVELEGHEAVLAQDDQDGLRQFRAGQFDLVICDVFTPDLPGLGAIIEIRGLSATTPIIAMSAGLADTPENRFRSDLLQLARHNGATLTLTKPFRHEQLIALVNRCLGK